MKARAKIFLLAILLVASFLRLWRISEVPVSLFGDELDVGYHAYSILKTGKDYSGNAWPLHFQSLAEWRTPLYLYSVVPTVAIFGISPLGVRLPAAFFGIVGIWALYLLVKELTKKESVALVAAAVLAFSPWHIQYSRAAFEVTMLLAFLLFGLYFFFKSLEKPSFLWTPVAFLAFTPWIYSTAKLFTPLLLLFLFLVWRKEVLRFPRKDLIKAAVAGLLIGVPIVYSTLFGGGVQRAGYLSVFTDPTRETEIGVARQRDARMRGGLGEGLQPTSLDKLTHNKFSFWTQNIVENYFQAFSTDFLFVKGDLNLRHSINNVGQFYWIEALALLLGTVLFFVKFKDRRVKFFIAFWIIIGVVPSAITRDGGRHATRLILILPPLVFLVSYGLLEGIRGIAKKWRYIFAIAYIGVWILELGFYQHYFWVHNPWDSERWWHSGFKEAIQSIKEIDKNYERVIISMAGEPAWIFFAGWYEYPPDRWHEGFPFEKQVLEGFGEISFIDKFYFGTPQKDVAVYGLGEVIDDKTLYLANAKEVGANLIMEPGRTPAGLTLIKAISYPSGEPAFYLFSGK
ncbi:glycosyltransferase family 39 protein [Patescibacteria group bacterium]|nr:glycosyltransferase family 39 protein [Patescibacteria group bacterium]